MDYVQIQARWNIARRDLLNLLLEFHNHWNQAFSVSHHCGHLKTPDIVQCRANVEKAWSEIGDLDDMLRRYKATIGEMREILQAMDEAHMKGPAR